MFYFHSRRNAFKLASLIGLSCLFSAGLHANPLLFPTDSDRDLERQIGQYLTDEKELKVTYRYLDAEENDLIAEVSFRDEGYPPINFILDAAVTARDEGGEVLESRVVVLCFFTYQVEESHPKRNEVLEYLNQIHATKWVPQRAYLDSDGDLRLESQLNIPSQTTPVHAEMVFDMIVRTSNGWQSIYDDLKGIGLEPK